MRQGLGVLCLITLLSGCAVKWYKPGATQSEFEYDKAQCTAEAYQQFPVANVSNTIGQATTTPILTTCQSSYGGSYGTTNCMTTGGQYRPAPTITYDANTGGRGAVFKACMYGRGYTTEAPAAIPPTAARPPQSTENYPPIDTTSARNKTVATPAKPPITEFVAVGGCEKLEIGGKNIAKQCGKSLRRTIYPNGWSAFRIGINDGQTMLFSTRPEVTLSPESAGLDVETLGFDGGKGAGVSFLQASGQCQILQVKDGKRLTCQMRAENDLRGPIAFSFQFKEWAPDK